MKKLLQVTLGTLIALTITNCSLFGGGNNSSDYEPDAYEDAEVSEDEVNQNTPEKYVSPDTYGDAETEKAPLDLDNEGYNGDASAQSDIAFGEGEDVPSPSDYSDTNDTPATREMSGVAFKQGMYDFAEDCQMREEADQNGSPAGMIRAGKKLWVEPVDDQWLRVYKKAGPVFISRGCL